MTRALAAFRIPELEHHLEILQRFLAEDDLDVVFRALYHFRHSAEPRRFCGATLKVLRRYSTDATRPLAAVFYKGLCGEEHAAADLPRRSVAFLMSSVFCGKYKGLTLYAILALGTLAGEWAVPFLTAVLRSEAWEDTRSAALGILVKLLGVQAGDLVAEMLADPSALMRGSAAADCFIRDFGNDFPPRVGALLFRLVTDEHEYASRYATYALQKWGYLAKDWYPHEGNPIYLGPPPPDTPELQG